MSRCEPAGVFRRTLLGGLTGAAVGATAACSPVDILNSLAPARLAADGLPYGPEQRQRLDVYRPRGSGPCPVAMFVYGGGWSSGDRAMYRFVGAALAASGIVTVIPDYRLFPLVRYPTFLRDCALAFAWTHRNARRLGGDGRAPCLIGHSAGAYNAAMLTLDARWLSEVGLDRHAVRRAVGLAGPYDFLPFNTAFLRELFATDPDPADTQPISHVDGRASPMLLLAGDRDRTVDPGNSLRLASRIRTAGGSAGTRIYRGIDHREIIGAFAGPLRFLAPSLADSVRFMAS